MRIKIEETKKKEGKLPMLFQTIDGDRMILLVESMDKVNGFLEGTALYSEDDAIRVGEHSSTWCLDDFEICKIGFKITIEQE